MSYLDQKLEEAKQYLGMKWLLHPANKVEKKLHPPMRFLPNQSAFYEERFRARG